MPHVTPWKEHHGGGTVTSVYARYVVRHEILPGDSWRAVTTFGKFSHVFDVGISVMKAHLAGSAILGNLSPVERGIGNREWH